MGGVNYHGAARHDVKSEPDFLLIICPGIALHMHEFIFVKVWYLGRYDPTLRGVGLGEPMHHWLVTVWRVDGRELIVDVSPQLKLRLFILSPNTKMGHACAVCGILLAIFWPRGHCEDTIKHHGLLANGRNDVRARLTEVDLDKATPTALGL